LAEAVGWIEGNLFHRRISSRRGSVLAEVAEAALRGASPVVKTSV